MSLIVMFDLENTIVDSWNSGCPLNRKINFMHNFIKNHLRGDMVFGIFSFACDRENEKPHAITLASYMNLPINPDWVVSFKEMEKLCQFQTDSLQKWEIVNLFGKDLMFPMFAAQHEDHDFVLFDDNLPNGEIRLSRKFKNNRYQMVRMVRVD